MIFVHWLTISIFCLSYRRERYPALGHFSFSNFLSHLSHKFKKIKITVWTSDNLTVYEKFCLDFYQYYYALKTFPKNFDIWPKGGSLTHACLGPFDLSLLSSNAGACRASSAFVFVSHVSQRLVLRWIMIPIASFKRSSHLSNSRIKFYLSNT